MNEHDQHDSLGSPQPPTRSTELPALLRERQRDPFDIRRCLVAIEVSPDYRTARYTYDLTIVKNNADSCTWREVFAYPATVFSIERVYTKAGDGLAHTVSDLEPEQKHACLEITLPPSLRPDKPFQFGFVCRTQLDGVSTSGFLSKSGVVFYWRADACPCSRLEIYLTLPVKTVVTGTHPQGTVTANSNVLLFGKENVPANEFNLVAVTYENRFLGIPVTYSKYIEGVVVAILGGLAWELVRRFFFA